jgi:hypothetical protein
MSKFAELIASLNGHSRPEQIYLLNKELQEQLKVNVRQYHWSSNEPHELYVYVGQIREAIATLSINLIDISREAATALCDLCLETKHVQKGNLTNQEYCIKVCSMFDVPVDVRVWKQFNRKQFRNDSKGCKELREKLMPRTTPENRAFLEAFL